MPALLRPHPHRGDTVAAGVVVLTLFAVVVNLRFAGTWSDAVRFLVTLVVAAPVLAMAVQSRSGDAVPRPYESVLYVASFVLVVVTLADLAAWLGSGRGPSAGTVTWVSLLVCGFCGWFARNRNSAIMTLLAAVSAVVLVLAFVDWTFGIDSATTVEWLFLACAVALTLGAISQRDARRRHAVSLVDAAGLTILALGFVVAVQQVAQAVFGLFSPDILGGAGNPFTGGPAGWELVFLAFGFGLIAYGCVDRERVPAFLGVLVLGVFVTEAFQPGKGASLVGWPIVLLILAGILLVIGLRPRQDLPPEPEVPVT
jgi:hypothetical protein